MDLEDSVRERLTAYIYPNRPASTAQEKAFEAAVAAQVEYEQRNAETDVPESLSAFAIGDFSVTAREASRSAAYTLETLSPYAWALLKNAGLLKGTLPVARRL